MVFELNWCEIAQKSVRRGVPSDCFGWIGLSKAPHGSRLAATCGNLFECADSLYWMVFTKNIKSLSLKHRGAVIGDFTCHLSNFLLTGVKSDILFERCFRLAIRSVIIVFNSFLMGIFSSGHKKSSLFFHVTCDLRAFDDYWLSSTGKIKKLNWYNSGSVLMLESRFSDCSAFFAWEAIKYLDKYMHKWNFDRIF